MAKDTFGSGKKQIGKCPYCKDPEILATAEFVKTMAPLAKRRRKPRFSFDSNLPLYLFLGVIFFAMLFMTLSPGNIREVRTTIIETPNIEEGLSVSAGSRPPSETLTLEGWWAMSLNTSCEGIDKFYRQTNFTSDWNNLLRGYNDIYSHNGAERFAMKPPIDMLKDPDNYDCEDIAHATRCLADYYNVTCSFWMNENTGKVIPTTEEHLGVCCEDPKGSWGCV